MIIRTQGLRQLTIISPPAPLNHGGPSHPSQTASSGCHGTSSGGGPIPSGRSAPPSRRPSTDSTESAEVELPTCTSCASCSQHDCASGASAPLPPPRHPREFIFEAWMRHVGPSLHSLTLSRALPATNFAKRPRGNGTSGRGGGDGGGRSVVVNLWEEEDASLHLSHISRHCTNLRSLSLGHVSLSAPTLLASLQPMPALQHLSFSWLHASPAALRAVLDAAPNLRHLTIFMASGFPYLKLRLPQSLQHLALSYIRAESVSLHFARSLQSLSVRDMFLSSLIVCDAPNLRQLAVASANNLLVSTPHSNRLASIDFRAGSLNWPATETLISSNSAALESLSLDFFATSDVPGLPSVSWLPWLTRNCPGLKSLRLGALAWQSMLESFTARIVKKAPEGLLLLHLILSNTPTLTSLHVTVEGEEDDEEEEEEEDMDDMEYDGDCDAIYTDEHEDAYEERYYTHGETNCFPDSPAPCCPTVLV
ncbi:unnamed protein product [Closterium sp. NIES-53]